VVTAAAVLATQIDIRMNWILLDKSHERIESHSILLPRNLFEAPSEDRRQLFIRRSREEFDIAPKAKDIKFWKAGGASCLLLRLC
jgi:hypothetical protein